MRNRTSQKKQKKYYSGKKKKHTLKAQLLIDAKSLDVLCVSVAKGSVHDFRLLKECGVHIPERIKVLADTGYIGIKQLHKNSIIPNKSSKYHKLTCVEKAENRLISSRRICIEHVNSYIKRFRILSSRYRNKHSRFALRLSLICGIYNHQH